MRLVCAVCAMRLMCAVCAVRLICAVCAEMLMCAVCAVRLMCAVCAVRLMCAVCAVRLMSEQYRIWLPVAVHWHTETEATHSLNFLCRLVSLRGEPVPIFPLSLVRCSDRYRLLTYRRLAWYANVPKEEHELTWYCTTRVRNRRARQTDGQTDRQAV